MAALLAKTPIPNHVGVPIRTLERPPRTKDTHLWADYVELLCLVNPDGLVARADLVDRWRTSDDLRRGQQEDIEVESSQEGTQGASALGDRRIGHADDVFGHFIYRAATFGDSYPFTVTELGALQRREILGGGHQLYVYLLLCSSLRYILRSEWDGLTKGFERLSEGALKAWLPVGAEVHIFGTSAGPDQRFIGTLQSKLTQLAGDLSERLLLTDEDFRRGDTGDAGCDIVGWIPLGDQTAGLLVILAQATCQVDWVSKQQESAPATWGGILTWTVPHNNVLCIPFCFRAPDGAWYWKRQIRQSIVIDRVRLLWLFRNASAPLVAGQVDVVARAIAFRESLF